MKTISFLDFEKTKLMEGPMLMSFRELKTPEYAASLVWLLESQFDRSCSSKVEGHIIITKTLFLMQYYSIYIDFAEEKLVFTAEDGKEYVMRFMGFSSLYKIYSKMFYNNKISIEIGDDYEEYRDHTRKILDRLDKYENESLFILWKDIVELSEKYFHDKYK